MPLAVNCLLHVWYDRYLSSIIMISGIGAFFKSLCQHFGLFVCLSDNWKSCERILTKFLGGVGHGPGTKWLNLGDNPDHCPDPGVWNPDSLLSKKYLVDSDQSCIANFMQKSFSNSIMLAFGRGLCSLSTSSYYVNGDMSFLWESLWLSGFFFLRIIIIINTSCCIHLQTTTCYPSSHFCHWCNFDKCGNSFFLFFFINPLILMNIILSILSESPGYFRLLTFTVMLLLTVANLQGIKFLPYTLQWVKKSPAWNFLTFFPKRLGIFSPNFTHLLYVPIYAGLHIFIQLPATLTKLCHIKLDHHNVLKMSTFDRNARWVVSLNMA